MSTLPDSTTFPGAGAVKRLPRARGESWPRRSARSLWERWNSAQAFVAPPREEWPIALRRARIVGFALLGVQLVALGWWSYVLASRYALTTDFRLYENTAYLVTHGHLGSTWSFLQNHADFIFLPIALVQDLWPHPVALTWTQDLASVGAEVIALAWICEIAAQRARRDRTVLTPVLLVGLGAVLLAANPWVVWASSFDYHVEAVSTLFLLATMHDLHRGRRRVWLWVVCCLLSGDIGATYVVAAGVSGVLAGRRWSRQGAAITALGVAWLIVVGVLHLNHGTNGHAYGSLVFGNSSTTPYAISALTVLTAVLKHPVRAIRILWGNRVNAWANLSPAGALGLFWLPVLPPLLLILGEGQLASKTIFAAPGFQNLAIASLTAVGTVAMCSAIAGSRLARNRWLVPVLATMLAANTVVWAVVWFPQVSSTWLRVTPAAARTLKSIEAKIGPRDEVVASQGISGGLSYRPAAYSMASAIATVPVYAAKVWIILAPRQGIETAPAAGVYADIVALTTQPDVRLVTAANGIWAYEWSTPRGAHELTIAPKQQSSVPAWPLAGKAGATVADGPASDWHVASTEQGGYVVDHAYWSETPGVYRASVSLSVSSTANVEVWDDTTSQLLSRQSVPGSNGRVTASTTVDLTKNTPQHLFSGWGIWRQGVTEPTGDQLEVRVWSPGGDDQVDVYNVSLQKG
jgi:Predicted membrane protein (DUF2079)